MLGAARLTSGLGVSSPKGQRLFLASGTFVVPAGVTSICAAAIGRGGNGYFRDDSGDQYSYGGSGGGLAYSNDLAVTPGETLTISITGDGSSLAGASALARGATNLVRATGAIDLFTTGGGTRTHGAAGFSGGDGSYQVSGIYFMADGGGAGGFTSAGGSQPMGIGSGKGGGGVSVMGGGAGGAAGSGPTAAGGTYGGGGGGGPSGSLSGGPGAVRIIWGAGRAFPNTNTGDVS